MSLVAYGASDDSETSDVDEAEATSAFAADDKISDEEDYVPTVSSHTREASSTNDTAGVSQSAFVPSSLSDLPAPKPVSSSSLQEEDGEDNGEDELEEEVKPKASQVADAPKPPPKKSKQPARIVIPALQQDSDEEEESKSKPKKQTVTTSSGSRSGLFALLPPPVHSSRKQTNRPLIPYTLTKRPTASKPAQPSRKAATASSTPTSTHSADSAVSDPLPSQKHQSAFNALTGYESDSDEEESGPVSSGLNFFSIGNEAGEVSTLSSGKEGESKGRTTDSGDGDNSDKTDVQSSSSPQFTPALVSVTKSESPVSSSTGVSSSEKSDSGSATVVSVQGTTTEDNEDGASGEDEVSSTVGVPQFNQDAPLNFSSSMQGRRWSAAPLVSPMLPEMYAAPSSSNAASYWQRQQYYAQDDSVETEQNVGSEAGSSSNSNIDQYMEDEQFLRLSGKRKRGQESIQLIDAHVDDYVDPSDLMKGISEESSYQPHRKKENTPSSQQKRKKQITYLAFQAKERELELKNAWSQNRMTKNQARSKYGF